MFGWLSRASAFASRANRSAKVGSRSRGRQDLQGDEAIERRLPGLVDRPHAALAEQFQDLQLREEFRHFLHGRGHVGLDERERWETA